GTPCAAKSSFAWYSIWSTSTSLCSVGVNVPLCVAHLSRVTRVTSGQPPARRTGSTGNGQSVTVTVAEAETPLTVTVTSAVPARRPVSIPVAGSTATIASAPARFGAPTNTGSLLGSPFGSPVT